jgi:hypothetical protein
MSEHRETHDGSHKVVLAPHLRAWFDSHRVWHLERVRVHAETRWVADGTQARVSIFLAEAAGTRGRALQRGDAKIVGGRLVGPDGARGLEHVLDWKLSSEELGAQGLVAEVVIEDYAVRSLSQTLQLDLQPFTISG